MGFSTDDISDRVKKFRELYDRLSTKPESPALLYKEPGAASVHFITLGEKLVIGRSADCGLTFDDETMGRRHFEIIFDRGVYRARDLESLNGTYINNSSQGIKEIDLVSGDIILAGDVIFGFFGG